MNYRRIDNRVGELKPVHAWIYYCLAFSSDFKTDISNIKQDSLAKKAGCSVECIKDAIKDFEQHRMIEKNTATLTGEKGNFSRNSYILNNGENYRFMSDKLFTEDISIELKGFLIIYWSLSLACENYLLLNANQCAEYISLSKTPIYNYIKLAIAAGYVQKDSKNKKKTIFVREDIFIPARKSAYRYALELYPAMLTDEDITNKQIFNTKEEYNKYVNSLYDTYRTT